MDKEILRMAKKAAKEEDLIYAPDIDALAWMYRFSEMVTIKERHRCAKICDDWGLPELAKAMKGETKKNE